jgi:catechol 2,3-dioxygenase-like lactoylglutathione lyase family enzyme
MAVESYGLTHISLAVGSLDRAVAFYRHVFGAEEVYRDAGSVQLQTPGSKDVIAFELDAERAGRSAGIAHFGFRLVKPSDIDEAVALALECGGTLARRGEFAPGFPFAYVLDPDGYEIEIWYE